MQDIAQSVENRSHRDKNPFYGKLCEKIGIGLSMYVYIRREKSRETEKATNCGINDDSLNLVLERNEGPLLLESSSSKLPDDKSNNIGETDVHRTPEKKYFVGPVSSTPNKYDIDCFD